MSELTKSERREKIFELLFENEFHAGDDPEAVFALAVKERDLPAEGRVKEVFLGVCNNLETIDALISKHAKGWKTNRLSKVSRSVIRLCVYEMKYLPDVPNAVAINEAVELSKKFDDEKARAFVNGVLNSIKTELESGGVQ